ncbi:hypothetical protein [Paenibacillus sp. 7516]|uniref:hypothetical protein n=1 Tax=Paenibacillus sp. 7516 TaxID=2022549 RepID=UPI001482BBE2|nr:hypothetical protein [Paenibacillus sp. 7516]
MIDALVSLAGRQPMRAFFYNVVVEFVQAKAWNCSSELVRQHCFFQADQGILHSNKEKKALPYE